MNPRNLILIVLAAVGVVLVVLLTRSFLTTAQQQARDTQSLTAPREAAIQILVAKRDLHVGTILKPEDTEWRAWPEKGVTEDYFVPKSDKKQTTVGQVVRAPLTKGEPVTKSAIVKQGERGFLAAILSPGMRAVTVKLSPTAGIGGFIFPGDRVDVLLTHSIELQEQSADILREQEFQVAETVFQNVRVLAVDQKSTSDDQARIGKTATLEVTPKMVEKVAMIANIGSLTLSLRPLALAPGAPLSDPNSPPIGVTTSYSTGHEISTFLPSLTDDQAPDAVRVTRGSSTTTVTPKGSQKAESN